MKSWDEFPFAVPVVRAFQSIETDTPVTFLVGENGSGKSTLLEALALAADLVAVGAADLARDETLEGPRRLAKALELTWNRRTRRGFFLRAEDFFGYARRIAALESEAEREIEAVDRDFAERSDYARTLARSPHARTLGEIRALYGEGLDARSHGESFLQLFASRLVDGGLYLLDEPEAPLSPLRQLAFLRMLQQSVEAGSQFVVATHSPILLAFPGAAIWTCDEAPMARVEWEDLEHVTLTRAFLNDPEAYLRRL